MKKYLPLLLKIYLAYSIVSETIVLGGILYLIFFQGCDMRNCSTIVSIYSIKDGSQEMLCGDRGVLCPSCRELRARDKLAEEREKDQ